MTITPARGAAPGSRTAKNRARRRVAAEPRHALDAAPEMPDWPPHPGEDREAGRTRGTQARRAEERQAARGTGREPARTAARRAGGGRADRLEAARAIRVQRRTTRAEQPPAVVDETPADQLPPPGAGDRTVPPQYVRREVRGHRAPARRRFLGATLLRCALYLGPLSVAVAAAPPLSQVAWPVPLVTLLLGWSAAQALTSVGVAVARRAGPSAAARLVGGGFAAVAGLWCSLVWVAPAGWVGHRGLALVIGLGGLATLATVTAALVTRSEAAIVRWSFPCWMLAAATLAGLAGDTVAAGVPIGTLLPAAIVVALVRAFQPVAVPGVRGRLPRLTGPELRRGAGYLVIGASQAICVGMLWQAGPSGSTAPFWLPLLLAVPILEALIGWHTGQVEAGLDAAENGADYGRHVRGVTLITLAGLLPPLAVGVTLAFAAYRLPAGLPGLAGTQAGVLGLAGGTLLGGVFAITYLLAARGRTATAAVLAAAPPAAAAVLPVLPLPAAGPLPDVVAVLAGAHLAGLLIVALTAADPRRTP